jgi:hypothetical protein
MYFQHSGGPYLTGTALKTYAAVTT